MLIDKDWCWTQTYEHTYDQEHGMNKHDSQLIGLDYYNKSILGYSRKD
jgi:hypothetical protein